MRKEPTQSGGKLRAIRERVEDQPGLDQAPDRSPDQAEQESAEQALLTQRLQAQYGHEQVTDALTGQDHGPMGTLILAEWALGTAGLPGLMDGPAAVPGQVFSTLQSEAWAETSAAILSRHETSTAPGHAHLAAELIRRSRGTRLPAEVAARLSAALGTDISDAVIHTDSAAAEAAQAVNAHAFATGRDVFFGAGEYKPGTREGDELLAHELTHVVQDAEGRIPQASGEGLTVSSPSDSHEREAEAAGREAMDVLHGAGDVELTAMEGPAEGETEALVTTGPASLLSRNQTFERRGTPRPAGESLSDRIVSDTFKGLFESFAEAALPPAKLVFLVRDIGKALADGIGKGLDKANNELLQIYGQIEHMSDEEITQPGALREMRGYQANSVDKLPEIIQEGLNGAAQEILKKIVADLAGKFAIKGLDKALEKLGIDLGDIVGDFLTGDYPAIMGRELITQPAEEIVEGATNYAVEEFTKAFVQATTTELMSYGLTEEEAAEELAADSGADLQISEVGRSVSQKLDGIKSKLEADPTGKPWEETYTEFRLAYNQCVQKTANLKDKSFLGGLFSGSDEDQRRIIEIRSHAFEAKSQLENLWNFHAGYRSDGKDFIRGQLRSEYRALSKVAYDRN
jgi:hypothetical protein